MASEIAAQHDSETGKEGSEHASMEDILKEADMGGDVRGPTQQDCEELLDSLAAPVVRAAEQELARKLASSEQSEEN